MRDFGHDWLRHQWLVGHREPLAALRQAPLMDPQDLKFENWHFLAIASRIL
jgi:hypothetical protein